MRSILTFSNILLWLKLFVGSVALFVGAICLGGVAIYVTGSTGFGALVATAAIAATVVVVVSSYSEDE